MYNVERQPPILPHAFHRTTGTEHQLWQQQPAIVMLVDIAQEQV